MAIAPDRIKTTHISGALLDDMTHDLRKINAQLIMFMLSGEMRPNVRQTYQELLDAAWRYKPALDSGKKQQKGPVQPHKKRGHRRPSRA